MPHWLTSAMEGPWEVGKLPDMARLNQRAMHRYVGEVFDASRLAPGDPSYQPEAPASVTDARKWLIVYLHRV